MKDWSETHSNPLKDGGMVAWWHGGMVAWCMVAWWHGGMVAWWHVVVIPKNFIVLGKEAKCNYCKLDYEVNQIL
jgi:hypothetical protein